MFGIRDPYVAWHRAKDQHINVYKVLLHHQLSEMAMSSNMEALKCSDVCCTDHVEEMHNIYYSGIKACDDCARKCIPSTRGHTGKKRLADWYDHVEEHHQLALHWHYCWKIEGWGRPHNGHTADMRRKTRARYHLAMRLAKKNKHIFLVTRWLMPLVPIAQGTCSLKHVKYALPGVEDRCVSIMKLKTQ